MRKEQSNHGSQSELTVRPTREIQKHNEKSAVDQERSFAVCSLTGRICALYLNRVELYLNIKMLVVRV